MPAPNDAPVQVMPFVLVFAVTYAALTAVVFAIITFLNLPANSGMAVGALIGAATFAASRFTSETGRAPQGAEILKLSGLSLLAVIAVSIPLTLAALAFAGIPFGDFATAMSNLFGSLGSGMVAGIVAFTLAVHFAVLYLSYGPLARFIARSNAAR